MLTYITKENIRNNIFKSLKCYGYLLKKKEEIKEQIKSLAFSTLTEDEYGFYKACLKYDKDFKTQPKLTLTIYYGSIEDKIKEYKEIGVNIKHIPSRCSFNPYMNDIDYIPFSKDEKIPLFLESISVHNLVDLKNRIKREDYDNFIASLNEYYDLLEITYEIADKLESILEQEYLTVSKLEKEFPNFYNKYVRNN